MKAKKLEWCRMCPEGPEKELSKVPRGQLSEIVSPADFPAHGKIRGSVHLHIVSRIDRGVVVVFRGALGQASVCCL